MSHPVFSPASSIPRAPGQQLGPWRNVNPAAMSPAPGFLPCVQDVARTPDIIPNVTSVDKPQNKVYVGKIASTVETDFVLALLQLCGPVKSWIRPQDLISGEPRSFGFCEFETAEGVLRASRLLNQLNIDGQKLLVKANQDENFKKADEDRKADQETTEKLNDMMKSRLKSNLSLPSPLPASDGSNSLKSELLVESEGANKGYEKRDRKPRPSNYKEKWERDLAERVRRNERKISLREKELEKYEGLIEKERMRREKDQKYEDKKDELVKKWEKRERWKISEWEKEKKNEEKRAFDRAQKILREEMESRDDESRKNLYMITLERKRRKIEKENDFADRIKEEQEAEIEEGEIVEKTDVADHHHIETGDDYEYVARTTSATNMLQDNTSSSKQLGIGREELQAIRSLPPGSLTSNLDVKRISAITSEEEETHIERACNNEKEETWCNRKLSELTYPIPETKEELFSYKINWDICGKYKLYDRMRPWIEEKVVDFFGAEDSTLVEYIVSSTQEHIRASEMLDRLEGIIDDDAEMFVQDMWKILISESQKIETGVSTEDGY